MQTICTGNGTYHKCCNLMSAWFNDTRTDTVVFLNAPIAICITYVSVNFYFSSQHALLTLHKNVSNTCTCLIVRSFARSIFFFFIVVFVTWWWSLGSQCVSVVVVVSFFITTNISFNINYSCSIKKEKKPLLSWTQNNKLVFLFLNFSISIQITLSLLKCNHKKPFKITDWCESKIDLLCK